MVRGLKGFVAPMVMIGLACVPRLAVVQAAKIIEKLTATVTGVNPGNGETVTIDILRWSTDEEAQQMLAAYKDKSDTQWVDVLQTQPSLGYVWTSGESIGYSIRYARRFTQRDGGERLIIAIDSPLGSWSRPVWKAEGAAAAIYSFSLIELHMTRGGTGEGKVSLAAKVGIDEATGSVALENYPSAPVLLKGVKRAQSASGATNSNPWPMAVASLPAPQHSH
jgi:hypothetical protein